MFILRQTGREDFPAFPYEPYNVQREFMQHVYSVLQTGGIGLLESPTGLLMYVVQYECNINHTLA